MGGVLWNRRVLSYLLSRWSGFQRCGEGGSTAGDFMKLETVETVSTFLGRRFTWLKPGVNEISSRRRIPEWMRFALADSLRLRTEGIVPKMVKPKKWTANPGACHQANDEEKNDEGD